MPAPGFIADPVGFAAQGDVVTADFSGWDIRDGDILQVGIRSQGTTPAEATLPTGWFRGGTNGSIPGGDRYTALLYHVVTDADLEPLTYTFSGVSGGGSSRIMAYKDVIRLADLLHVNDGGLMYRPDAFIPAVSAGGTPFLLLTIWAAEFTAGISVIPNSVPSNLTIRKIFQTSGGGAIVGNEVTTGSRTGIIIATQEVPSGGSTAVPAMTMGWAGSPTSIKSASMMIRGLASAPAMGAPVKKGDGSAARLSYLDGAGARSSLKAHIWHPGFNDVEAFVAKKGANAAHRGGSATLPEYSERAYDVSVFRNYGTLEISCAFSSDGVPFGNGEQYLDRMAGVTGNVDPRTIPWATLQANYRNVLNPVEPGVSQPLLSLERMLEKYTPNHVVLVDPKFAHGTPALVSAMLDLCLAYGGPDKIIIKFDSPLGNNNLINAAHAAGFIGMNYWGTEVEKLTPAYGVNVWDLLGIRYDTTQANYETIKGFGKPVWAAVIPNQTGYDLATTRGADLMMCSNVQAIKAVR